MSAPRLIAAGGALVGALVPPFAAAQPKPIEASITSTVTATTNGAASAQGLEQRDLLLSVRPGLSFARTGAGLKLRGDLGVELVASKNGTREDKALPYANASAEATLVDRLLFVDAALDVRQIEENPFASRVEQGSSQNARTAGTARVSPYVAREFTDDLSLLARADVGWARYEGDPTQDSRTGRLSVKLNAKPRPLGGLVDLESQKAEYSRSSANDWRVDTAIIGPTFSLNGELVLGLVGGAERTTASGITHTDRRAGLTVYWAPTQRTTVAANVDRRFFGTGFSTSAMHRTPYASFALRAAREPMLPTMVGVGAKGSLPAFLDAILTTRYPDPNQRGALVGEMVSTRGMQTSLQGTAGTAGGYAQLGSGGDATIVLLGTRNTVAVSVYQQTITLLTRSDGSSQFLGTGSSDNRQGGATLGLNRRLTPNVSADFSARWSRIQGLALRAGDVTRESSVHLAIVRNTAPRTSVSLGMQYRQSDTNVAGLASFKEGSAFAGLAHRF